MATRSIEGVGGKMKFVKIVGSKKAPYPFLGHYGILEDDGTVEIIGRVGLKGSMSVTVVPEDYEVIGETLPKELPERQFYSNGFCMLTEEKVKCIYGSKYVFCPDCARRNMIETQPQDDTPKEER